MSLTIKNSSQRKSTAKSPKNFNSPGVQCGIVKKQNSLQRQQNRLSNETGNLKNKRKLLDKQREMQQSATLSIERVYERLQQKYCKNFKLENKANNIKRPALGNHGKSKPVSIKRIENARNTTHHHHQKSCLAEEPSIWNFRADGCQDLELTGLQNENKLRPEQSRDQPLNAPTLDKSHDSDKTLVTEANTSSVPPLSQNKNSLAMEIITASQSISKPTPASSYQENLYPQRPDVFDHCSRPISDANHLKYSRVDSWLYDSKVVAGQRKTSPAGTQTIPHNHKSELEKKLRQAIILGKSADAFNNKLLANAINQARTDNYSFNAIQSAIDNIKRFRSQQKVLHLLQIELQHGVFILCTVRTCNFSQLLASLDKIMQPVKAKLTPVVQHFSQFSVIQAIVPRGYFKLPPQKLRRNLHWDAEFLKAKRIALTDEAKGEVCVQCEPNVTPKITQALQKVGYKLITSEYGFRARKDIYLDSATANRYRKLLRSLTQLEAIETIVDNVAY